MLHGFACRKVTEVVGSTVFEESFTWSTGWSTVRSMEYCFKHGNKKLVLKHENPSTNVELLATLNLFKQRRRLVPFVSKIVTTG